MYFAYLFCLLSVIPPRMQALWRQELLFILLIAASPHGQTTALSTQMVLNI